MVKMETNEGVRNIVEVIQPGSLTCLKYRILDLRKNTHAFCRLSRARIRARERHREPGLRNDENLEGCCACRQRAPYVLHEEVPLD